MTKKPYRKCPKCGNYINSDDSYSDIRCGSCDFRSYSTWDNWKEIKEQFEKIPIEMLDILPDNKIKQTDGRFVLTYDEDFDKDDRFEMFMRNGELMALGVDCGGYDVCYVRLLPADIDKLIEWLKERKEELVIEGD